MLNLKNWRRRCEARGLLVSSKKATAITLEKQKASSKACGPEVSGVSLHWLQRFADTIAEEAPRHALSTATVVAKLVSPACVVKIPPPSAALPDAAQSQGRPGSTGGTNHSNSEQIYRSNQGSLSGTGRLVSTPDGSTPTLPGQGPRDVHVPLWDLIPAEHTGRPDYYIIHAWQGNCAAMLHAVVRRLLQHPGVSHDAQHDVTRPSTAADGSREPSGWDDQGGRSGNAGNRQQGAAMPEVYVWIDWIALQQQAWVLGPGGVAPQNPRESALLVSTANGPLVPQYYGPPAGLLDVASAREVQSMCARGAVLVLDEDMAVLQRAWPLYETWACTYYASSSASGSGMEQVPQQLLLTLVQNMPPESLLAMHHMCGRLDLAASECSRQEDKQRIVAAVKAAAGLKRMQQSLGETLLTGVRGYLRWSGDLADLALFVVLLLQSGDYAQVQALLHSLPGLQDDENTLKEIRAIFVMYDSDGTGELEEDEFCSVLALAGFQADEASAIFSQVDVDGGGSVGMEEFETWWIETQRQQARDMRPAIQLTQGSLQANLEALAVMLERRELPTQAALIMHHAEQLAAYGIGGVRCADAALPPYSMTGDYLSVADQVVFKIMSGQLKPALRLVLELLALNWDALTLDAPPATLLPSTSMIAHMAPAVQRAALAWGMALVAELLGRNIGRMCEAEHFAREALELVAQGGGPHHADEGSGGLSGLTAHLLATKRQRKRNKGTRAKNQKDRDAIVTSMVRLKYGREALISHKLIAEASISLSTWMAGSKSSSSHKFLKGTDHTPGGKKQHAAAAAADVTEFANSYLGAGQVTGSTEGSTGNTVKEQKLPMPLPQLCKTLQNSYQVVAEFFAKQAAAEAAAAAAAAAGPTTSRLPSANSMDLRGMSLLHEDEEDLLLPPVAETTGEEAVTSPHPEAGNDKQDGPLVDPRKHAHARKQPAGSKLTQLTQVKGAGGNATVVVEADDAGVEHLTRFAKAMRHYNYQDEIDADCQHHQHQPLLSVHGHVPTSRGFSGPPCSCTGVSSDKCPMDQLGSRFERVRTRQAAIPRATSPPPTSTTAAALSLIRTCKSPMTTHLPRSPKSPTRTQRQGLPTPGGQGVVGNLKAVEQTVHCVLPAPAEHPPALSLCVMPSITQRHSLPPQPSHAHDGVNKDCSQQLLHSHSSAALQLQQAGAAIQGTGDSILHSGQHSPDSRAMQAHSPVPHLVFEGSDTQLTPQGAFSGTEAAASAASRPSFLRAGKSAHGRSRAASFLVARTTSKSPTAMLAGIQAGLHQSHADPLATRLSSLFLPAIQHNSSQHM